MLLVDQAGWHISKGLVVSPNITIMALPPKCPELNPVIRPGTGAEAIGIVAHGVVPTTKTIGALVNPIHPNAEAQSRGRSRR